MRKDSLLHPEEKSKIPKTSETPHWEVDEVQRTNQQENREIKNS